MVRVKRVAATDDKPERLIALDRLLSDGRPKSGLETLSIQRQMLDLEKGHERGLAWDGAEADRVCRFFGLLTHWKGRDFAGKPVTLEPWQQECIIRPLFGWKLQEDQTRRYRTSYNMLSRKNGKTTMTAGVGLWGITGDREDGAEVYSAALTLDQANQLFSDAKNLGRKSKQIQRKLNILEKSITCPALSAVFKPLVSDADVLHGKNIHFALVDELHAQGNRELWDVLKTGTGARTQPLMMAITTAGTDKSSICYEQQKYAEMVLSGKHQDDSYHAFIAAAEPDDDPFVEETWKKANPNYGVSLKRKYLADLANEAKVSAPAENTFRRLHLGQWTEQAVRWIQMHLWNACYEKDFPDLRGRVCYAGLDLAETRDINALVLVFKIGSLYYIKQYFWVPEGSVSPQAHSDRRIVLNWASQGYIKKTAGNVADYDTIIQDIVAISKMYNIERLAYDPNGPAAAIAQQLAAAGFSFAKLRSFTQNFGNYAAPTKEFERLIASGRLRHDGDPVMDWMIGNVSVDIDNAGSMMPSKRKSQNKIDGVAAAVMALAESLVAPIQQIAGPARGYKAQF